MFFSKAFVAFALAASAQAHMIMKSPIPNGKSKLNNSPLDASGSDFPCKGLFEPDSDADINHIAIGEPQTLAFTGQAIHGGGSCQVSLSKDLAPTKSSKWMVIKSIEGGCPGSAAGNLGSDPNGGGSSTFQYTVPDGIAPGQYTIAWTWVNRIGNREFYMNCGRADITAAKKKRYAPAPVVRRQSTFPDMFVANLASINTCATPEGINIVFPDAGPVVQKVSGNGDFGNPTGNCGATVKSDAGNSGSGNSGSASSSAAAPSATVSNAPGNFAGGASPTSTAVAATTTTAAAVTTTAAQTTAAVTTTAAATTTSAPAPAAPTSVPETSTGSSTAGAACSTEGEWSCAAGGASFQRCASGVWSPAIPMAAGMTCVPGLSADITMKVATPAGGKLRRSFNA